jgi:hypothetical protein
MREIDLLKYVQKQLCEKFKDRLPMFVSEEDINIRGSLSKDMIEETLHDIVYRNYSTIYYVDGSKIISKSQDETYEFLINYFVRFGMITDMITELNNDKSIDKLIFIGSHKSIFRNEDRQCIELQDQIKELLLNSIKSLSYFFNVHGKRHFLKQSGDYTIEVILEYEPTVIIRRITKEMIEDNSLEFKILSTLLNAPVVGGENGSIVSDVLSLSEELSLKKKIQSLLREELTNIYADRNVL